MSKSAFFARHQSSGHSEKVEGVDGLPELFMRKLSHGEYSDCLAEKTRFDGKKGFIVDYAVACVVACVDKDGKTFFTRDDLGDLQLLGQEGITPFVTAFNKANGLGDGDDPKKDDSGETAVAA